MAHYRKLLIVSPALAAIVMLLYGHPLVDWNPEQNQWGYAEPELEQVEENLAGSQIIPAAKSEHQVPARIKDESPAEVSQNITRSSESITLSGWIGTEIGENIAFETVVLFSPTLRTYHSVVTGPSGEYSFTDLKPGWDYVLKVAPQGMFKRYTQSYIKLRSDQEVHNIVLEPIPLGILLGTMLDPYGRPVSGIKLHVQNLNTADSWIKTVITDANGSFSVAEFPKGRFQVATKGRYQAATSGQQTLMATGLKFDPDSIVPVKLTIDLGPYNLDGRIYDESGQTFDGADVFLNWTFNENDIRIRSTRRVSVEAGGGFQFTGLGPGEHKLVITAWRGSSFKQTLQQTVNVGVDSAELMIVINTF